MLALSERFEVFQTAEALALSERVGLFQTAEAAACRQPMSKAGKSKEG